MKRYSIETPPYARGRLVEDSEGNCLKLDEVAKPLNGAIHALERAKNYPCLSMYQVAEIDSAILAMRSVVGFPEVVGINEAA